MVAYYADEHELDEALAKVKTSEEAWKIAGDLEQRMAPRHWLAKAIALAWSLT